MKDEVTNNFLHTRICVGVCQRECVLCILGKNDSTACRLETEGLPIQFPRTFQQQSLQRSQRELVSCAKKGRLDVNRL